MRLIVDCFDRVSVAVEALNQLTGICSFGVQSISSPWRRRCWQVSASRPVAGCTTIRSRTTERWPARELATRWWLYRPPEGFAVVVVKNVKPSAFQAENNGLAGRPNHQPAAATHSGRPRRNRPSRPIGRAVGAEPVNHWTPTSNGKEHASDQTSRSASGRDDSALDAERGEDWCRRRGGGPRRRRLDIAPLRSEISGRGSSTTSAIR